MKRLLLIGFISLLLTSCKNNTEMKYETKELSQFYIVGISVRTTNQNSQSQKDIGDLFTKYMISNSAARYITKYQKTLIVFIQIMKVTLMENILPYSDAG